MPIYGEQGFLFVVFVSCTGVDWGTYIQISEEKKTFQDLKKKILNYSVFKCVVSF